MKDVNIIVYTYGAGQRSFFGDLALARHEDGSLTIVGTQKTQGADGMHLDEITVFFAPGRWDWYQEVTKS